MHLSNRIRAVTRADVDPLKTVIDATGLFPSELLDGMLEGAFSGERADDRWLTVEHDDAPIAVATYAPEPMTDGAWNLLLIAVHPSAQGQGFGQALMRHAESALAARGQRVLLVETSGLPQFDRARRFYRELGYAEEARIRDYYEAGDDKVVFWKSLTE